MQYEEFYFISRHNRVNPQAFFYENSFNLLKKIPKIFQELEIDFTCVHYFINKTGAPLSCVIICLAHSGQQWCVTISAQFLASQLICHVKKKTILNSTVNKMTQCLMQFSLIARIVTIDYQLNTT